MASYLYKEIGERLKQLRAEFSETQEDFSIRTGINRAYLSEMEIGRKRPSSKILSLLIAATNVNSNWLLTGEGDLRTDDYALEESLKNNESVEDVMLQSNASRMMYLDTTGQATKAAILIGAAPEHYREKLVTAIERELFFLSGIEKEEI